MAFFFVIWYNSINMTSVAEAPVTLPEAIPINVAETQTAIAVPEQQLAAAESSDRPGFLRRLGACVAAGAVLAVGACSATPNTSDRPDHSPAISAPVMPYSNTHSQLKAAQRGPLHMGMIIVRPRGATDPTYGFTEADVTKATVDAENAITQATDEAVKFTPPTYYGNIDVPVTNPQDACHDITGGVPNKAFVKEVREGALAHAEAQGYQQEENVGLLMYVDTYCEKGVKSFASKVGGMFQPGNALYITGDARKKRGTVAHELGHELGNDHSDQLLHSGDERPNEFGPADSNYGYGNPRTIMGSLPQAESTTIATFNGYELYTLGAIQQAEVNVIDKPGEYAMKLTDINAQTPGQHVKLLRLPRARNANDGLDSWWVELSRAPKIDQTTMNGVELSKGDERELGIAVYAGDRATSNIGGHTYLATLESTVSKGVGAATKALDGYTIFQEPTSGLYVKLNSIDGVAGTADITITYKGKSSYAIDVPRGFIEGNPH